MQRVPIGQRGSRSLHCHPTIPANQRRHIPRDLFVWLPRAMSAQYSTLASLAKATLARVYRNQSRLVTSSSEFSRRKINQFEFGPFLAITPNADSNPLAGIQFLLPARHPQRRVLFAKPEEFIYGRNVRRFWSRHNFRAEVEILSHANLTTILPLVFQGDSHFSSSQIRH